MELGELLNGEAACTAKIGDNEICFTYNPGLMTLNFASKLDGSYMSMAEVLNDLLISWDLTSDGEPLEVTSENLSSLPLEWLTKINDVIFEDVRSEKN